jgi:hypothetical protein
MYTSDFIYGFKDTKYNLPENIQVPQWIILPFKKKKYTETSVKLNKKDIISDIRCLLNKLTDSNLKKATSDIQGYTINKTDTPEIIKLLYSKFTSDISFSYLYVNLLYKLKASNFYDVIKEPLLDKMLSEFNNNNQRIEIGEIIAQMSNRKLLHDQVIKDIIKTLMDESTDNSIEVLCKLLLQCNKKTSNKIKLDTILIFLKSSSKNNKYRLRTKFIIVDFLENKEIITLLK